jgi:hypothetical protein
MNYDFSIVAAVTFHISKKRTMILFCLKTDLGSNINGICLSGVFYPLKSKKSLLISGNSGFIDSSILIKNIFTNFKKKCYEKYIFHFCKNFGFISTMQR